MQRKQLKLDLQITSPFSRQLVAAQFIWAVFYIFSTIFLQYPLAFCIAACHHIDMFCINCFHKSTQVVNSRPHKKLPSIWRRRKCTNCGTVFSTSERPSLADNKSISLPGGSSEGFNSGKLIISIASAFTHAPEKAKYDALWLAQTIEATLSIEYTVITPEDIAAVTHQVLKQFDELAALQYAAKHHLISTTRRRGRPSISPAGREPQTDA